MPTPGFAASHIDAVLTNISIAYMQDSANFIANKVFPVVPVDKASAIYYKYNQEDWLRDEAAVRADATESVGSGYTLGQDTYNCPVQAIHKDVGDQVVRNATSPLAPMRDATQFVASRLLLRQEVDFATQYFKTGVWGNDWTGIPNGTVTGNEFVHFDDYVNSTPIEVIDAAKEDVSSVTGFDINTMVIGKQVFNKLKNHPEIVDRIKYTSSNVVTAELLARYFGVDQVLVARSIVNKAKEGQTKNIAYNYGKGILLVHAAPNPGLLTPSAGYTFSWNGVTGTDGLTVGTYQIRMEELKATRIESEAAWDNKVVAPDLGVFLDQVIS
jgi:hypothetical protein